MRDLRIRVTSMVTNQQTTYPADYLASLEQAARIVYRPQRVNCNTDTGDIAQ